MITESVKKLLLIPSLLLLVAWIMFNPYIYSANSEFICSLCFSVNDLCGNINLNYRFSSEDILALLRFFEYFILGIVSAVLYKIYFKRIWANITNLLFLGLTVSIVEIYLRNFGIYKLEVRDILISFFEFCAGIMIILIFRARKNKKAFSSKYKKNKYAGRG